MNKNKLEEYITLTYGTNAEHPWGKYPSYSVFRHQNNNKWFALIMSVAKEKLGICDNGVIDILNVKCDPIMIGSLITENGFYPAYHMNKSNWITVALDGSADNEKIKFLLDMSFDLTTKGNKNMKKIIKLIPLMLILVLVLTSCQKNAENSGKPKVYTSFYAMYDFAKTIGGDDIDLTNIVPTGTEPHDFEPTASDMAKLSEADVFIYNGVGMESWADKIIETLPQNVKVICTSEQIPTDGNDPHIWLSPQNAKLQMQAICNVLSEVDSKNAQNYINRLDSYLTQIDEVDTEYKNAELDGKTIFVTHGAYSYLCNDYGMKQVALEGVTGDSDPSPAQMAKLVDQIKSEGVSCIFYDPLEGDKMAQAVANEADIQALPLYTFEGDSESRDYVTVMKANLEELKKGI